MPGNIRSFDELQNFATGAYNNAQGVNADSRNRFMGALDRQQSFDPTAAIAQQAQGAYQGLNRQFQAGESQRMAGLNRRGLSGSNIGGASAQNHFHQALAEALANISMQGASMDMQNRQNLSGQYGNLNGQDNANQNRYFDAVYGAGASHIGERLQSHAASQQRRAGLVGGLISMGGSILSGGLANGGFLNRNGGAMNGMPSRTSNGGGYGGLGTNSPSPTGLYQLPQYDPQDG